MTQLNNAPNGTRVSARPIEDAHVYTRKAWSEEVADWGLPSWLLFDHLEESDADRVLRYFSHCFANVSGRAAYVADPYGTWIELLHRASIPQSIVREMIIAARTKAALEVDQYTLDIQPVVSASYSVYLSKNLRLTGNHVSNVAWNLKLRIMGGKQDGVRRVAPEDFDDRNEHPVIPLRDGGSLDLTTGQTRSVDDTIGKLLKARGWQLPMLDRSILESESPGACAMREAIADRFGHTLISRLARHALGTSKSIDAIVAPTNWGKSTLISLMEKAFPGMAGRIESGRALSTGGDRYSVVTSLLAKHLWVFVDEAGGKAEKPIHGSLLKTWIDDGISVEQKFENRETVRRLGTAVFIGFDFPMIDTSDQGMEQRFRWSIALPDMPMTSERRELLLSDDAVAFFRQTVMSRAVALWNGGQPDADTFTPEVRESTALWISKRKNPLAAALQQVYEQGSKKDFVPSTEIVRVLESVSDDTVTGTVVRDTMATAFHHPDVMAVRRKRIRGWAGIKLRKNVSDDDFK